MQTSIILDLLKNGYPANKYRLGTDRAMVYAVLANHRFIFAVEASWLEKVAFEKVWAYPELCWRCHEQNEEPVCAVVSIRGRAVDGSGQQTFSQMHIS